KAGLARSGWGQGVCIGDYDNDGYEDLFISYYGQNALYHNNGNGTFTDVTAKAGLTQKATRWSTGCAFVDYDLDGNLDMYVANDSTASALFHNLKNGRFEDIGIAAGAALSPDGKPQAGMGIAAGDYDHDGHLDIVKTNFAGDTHSLYRNLGNGNFDDM